MNKCKIIIKDSTRILTMKGQKGQQLNLREVELLQKQEVRGVAPLSVVQSGKSFTLNYNITGYKTLQEFLQTDLSKTAFANLLEEILLMIRSMQVAYFSYKNLLLDFDTIFINPEEKKIAFIYVPIQNYDNNKKLKDFFFSIAKSAVFSQDENTGYIRDYIKLLNSEMNFSLFEMEEYIKKISDGLAVVNEPEKEKITYLIRKKTQERIVINKPVFRIGKEINYCDYCIPDNKTISRRHADIMIREGRYFIIDNQSTNGTYVDGKIIPVNAEVEIYPGSGLRLADEDFIFIIDDGKAVNYVY